MGDRKDDEGLYPRPRAGVNSLPYCFKLVCIVRSCFFCAQAECTQTTACTVGHPTPLVDPRNSTAAAYLAQARVMRGETCAILAVIRIGFQGS